MPKFNKFDIVLTPNKSVAVITEISEESNKRGVFIKEYAIDYIFEVESDDWDSGKIAWWEEEELKLAMDFGSYLKLLPKKLQLKIKKGN